MGHFGVNFHAQKTDAPSVTRVLTARGISNFHVFPDGDRWTSFYEEHASKQDEARIQEVAVEVSRKLRLPVIAFLVHDSDIACYWLFDDGKLLDEFNSCPHYFDDAESDDGPTGGDVELLLRYCVPLRGFFGLPLECDGLTSLGFANARSSFTSRRSRKQLSQAT